VPTVLTGLPVQVNMASYRGSCRASLRPAGHHRTKHTLQPQGGITRLNTVHGPAPWRYLIPETTRLDKGSRSVELYLIPGFTGLNTRSSPQEVFRPRYYKTKYVVTGQLIIPRPIFSKYSPFKKSTYLST
jgi:hypothetical protein